MIAAAQSLVVMGFSFMNPFLPLFQKTLGNLTESDAAFWGGLAIGASPLAMFLTAPAWGMVADRWGRKPMVLRAIFGSAVVVASISLAPDIYWVVGLRFTQGIFSGTMAAASALVASIVPRDKLPQSMGTLMVAMFSGNSLGPLFGGMVADSLGFRNSFLVTGVLLAIGGFIVFFLVKENFHAAPRAQRVSAGAMFRMAGSREVLPLLTAICILQIGPQIISPVVPLLMSKLDPAGPAATYSGIALGATGVVAAFSSWAFGRITGRLSLKRILVYSCLGCAAIYLPPAWAASVLQLIIMLAVLGLFKGGLMASSNSLVGLSVPAAQHGVAYGLGQSANSLGSAAGPLLGGIAASGLGLQSVFPITAALFLLVGVLMARFLADIGVKKKEQQTSTTTSKNRQ